MKRKRTSGEDRAAAVLARQRARFLSFLEARIGSRSEAEEILQAAYLKALRSSVSVREEEKLTAWFFRILRNALTDHWRRRAAESRALDQYGAEGKRQARVSEAELNRRVCACVGALVATIKPEYAEAVREVDIKDASVASFARRAGVTANSAAVRLHRARQSLKKRVIETCGSCAKHGCRDCDCGRV